MLIDFLLRIMNELLIVLVWNGPPGYDLIDSISIVRL